MAGVNKVVLVGHLGADPEMKNGSSGNPFTTFSLATSDNLVKDGQCVERTEWHRIIAFGKLAEICDKLLHKGKQIYLEGRIQTRSWEQDGVKRYTTEIIAGTMQMIGGREVGGDVIPITDPDYSQDRLVNKDTPVEETVLDSGLDDIPF